jgi:hypothetical protein
MASSKPPRSNSAPVPFVAEIVDIEDRDGPRAAYAALQARLKDLHREGAQVPQPLSMLEQRLLVECCAESQGR